jgi:protoporphyrinogen/coproporphyrinogen III oxidase
VSTPRVVVIGGGLTGLATAWRLREHAEVMVLEAGERLGGQIRTIELAGIPLDVGADAFLARQPEGERLVRDAGLGDRLVSPTVGRVALWQRGRLRLLPPATVFGAPTDPIALARSGVLSLGGVARAAAEPLLPRRFVAGDRSVADLVGERFGREVVDVLVEPLLGGVYAGRADDLSARATMPPVWAAAREHRSLMVGLLADGRAGAGSGAEGPVFATLRDGLEQLIERLHADLGPRVRTGARVTALQRQGDAWAVQVRRGAGALELGGADGVSADDRGVAQTARAGDRVPADASADDQVASDAPANDDRVVAGPGGGAAGGPGGGGGGPARGGGPHLRSPHLGSYTRPCGLP